MHVHTESVGQCTCFDFCGLCHIWLWIGNKLITDINTGYRWDLSLKETTICESVMGDANFGVSCTFMYYFIRIHITYYLNGRNHFAGGRFAGDWFRGPTAFIQLSHAHYEFSSKSNNYDTFPILRIHFSELSWFFPPLSDWRHGHWLYYLDRNSESRKLICVTWAET